jgi:anti-sigma B factor antagonist
MGGIFILAALSEHTMKLIKISQLDGVLNIMSTIDEAIDAALLHNIESESED